MLAPFRTKFVLLIFTAVCLFNPGIIQSQATDPELVRLRNDWAMRFFAPGPHMELAKYFRSRGNTIQAFYILENARRQRFETDVVDAAFLLHFGGFAPLDNSKTEEAKYVKLHLSSPEDIKIIIHLADIYISRGDFTNAEPLLKLALEKEPKRFSSVGALAEIYHRQNTPEKAKKLLADFEQKYPTAAESYDMRIKRLLDTEPEKAKELLAEATKEHPNAAVLWFYLAVLADRDKKLDLAEQYFVKAADLGKNSTIIQAYTAAFFRTKKHDNGTALKYYLNTYFLDPHAHFDGFAEAKISNLNYSNSVNFVEKSILAGKTLEYLLQDSNPTVVAIALSKIAGGWDSSKTDLFIQMMRHDDVLVRWSATQTLTAKEGRKLDTKVRNLLNEGDLRVRGLAAYMAVRLWKEESFPEMRKMLGEEAQVLKFDAISALLMEGGAPGRKIVSEHKSKEPNQYLKKAIEAFLSKDPS